MNNIEKSEKTKNIIKDYKNSSNKDLSFAMDFIQEDFKLTKESLEDLYKTSEERLDGKQLYAKLIHEWHLVERNMSLMDLQETMLSEWDIEQVIQVLAEPNIKLHSGAFLRLLEVDQVQGPSSHPEPWLEVFRDLDLYIKNK